MKCRTLIIGALAAMALSGCGKSVEPASVQNDAGTNLSKDSSPREIDKALMPGHCDEAAKGAFLPEGDEVSVAELPAGEYEYQWGELFVSEIQKEKLSQFHLVDTSPSEETGPGTVKCTFGLGPQSNMNGVGSFPQGFRTTDELAFSVEKHRRMEVGAAGGEITHSVSDQVKEESCTREMARQGAEKALAAGVEMKMYRINGSAYKMVVIFRAHEGGKTTGTYSTGFYKFSPKI